MISQKEQRDKGGEAEKKFQSWLRDNKIPYWYIQQDISTFSPELKKYMSKRPDFMVLIPHIGFILVDAEYKKPAEKYENFNISEQETEQYCNLQNYFNLPVWYAFANERDHFDMWYWIPVSKVLEFSKKDNKIFNNKNPRDGGRYCAVSMKKFIRVSQSDNLGRLFAEMHKFY